MAKYINAELIQQVIDWWEHKEVVSETDLQSAFIDIKNLPAADVVEVKHEKWISPSPLAEYQECSVCGYRISERIFISKKFCPNCGADMRERREETE